MDNPVTLSYVLTTFNKLNYLKVTLPYLIGACKNDEEIVVTDGGSSDGTKEYLEELFRQGKIHQYLSEKDCGEAHGTNKSILMAKGELIKLITDDDVFDFTAIEECKNYMLQHPDVDVMAGNVFQFYLSAKAAANVIFSDFIETEFQKWKAKQSKNCFFCGLTLLIRKKSLPLTGLFNPYFKMIDVEYSVRLSSINASIAFYTKPMVTAIINDNSNSNVFVKNLEIEKIKIALIYEYFGDHMNDYYFFNPYSVKESLRFFLYRVKLRLIKKKFRQKTMTIKAIAHTDNYEFVYHQMISTMREHNLSNQEQYKML